MEIKLPALAPLPQKTSTERPCSKIFNMEHKLIDYKINLTVTNNKAEHLRILNK